MYYKKEVTEILKEFRTSYEGLTEEEARLRLKTYGKNIFQKLKKTSILNLFFNQFKNFIIYVLFGSALLAFIFGKKIDAFVILSIVFLNAILGFFQEYKAERSIEALKKLTQPKAIVLRNNKTLSVDSSDIVPGDILILEEGAYISADARLLEVSSLTLDESTLTGESIPVSKSITTITQDVLLSSQKNMVFAGTLVNRGRGKAVVVSTGFSTQLGTIAKEIQLTEEKETPLQKKLHSFGIFLTVSILFICALIFLLNFFKGISFVDSFLIAIALAVAAIPEGLPAVITITLALGTQRMLKKNALMRKLSAVEALGSVTVICTDKTGTLTKNEMTVTKIFTNNKLIEVTGKGYETKGMFFHDSCEIEGLELKKIMEIASLCTNASLEGPCDPTEKALLVAAVKSNFHKKAERIKEVPFSSETKFMITLDKVDNNLIYHLKGAPEVVLEKCTKIFYNHKEINLTTQQRRELKKTYESLASEALRVVALAYSQNEKDYVFVGFMGMIDPPREHVKSSIELCKKAGIKVIMITGDHALTARAIAQEVGIIGELITGEELEKMHQEHLEKIVASVQIYARVTPHHKLRILKALQAQGHIVAMTGDGVNDALTLKNADIGISVGSGTDLAKSSSDMILLDDNFVTLVHAIKEGRGIYKNMKEFIGYLFSCNLSEILVLLFSVLIGLPLPLIPIQLLLINLLTDSFPALALGLNTIEDEIMSEQPRNPKENILTSKDLLVLFSQAAFITLLTLGFFIFYLKRGTLVYAQTVAFTMLVFAQLANTYNYRACKNSHFLVSLFAHKILLFGIGISFFLQLITVYFLSTFFKTVPLLLFDLILIFGFSLLIIVFNEILKLFLKIDS